MCIHNSSVFFAFEQLRICVTCWQQYRDVSFRILVMSPEPETGALKYWKVDLMGREDEADRCVDAEMISRAGQTGQWQSVQGWRSRDRQQ